MVDEVNTTGGYTVCQGSYKRSFFQHLNTKHHCMLGTALGPDDTGNLKKRSQPSETLQRDKCKQSVGVNAGKVAV